MIQVCINPKFDDILKWVRFNDSSKFNSKKTEKIISIIKNVQLYGDKALKIYTKKYDNVKIDKFLVSKEDFYEANKKVSSQLKESINLAYKNIKVFHQKQIKKEQKLKISQGISCWIKNVPIEKIGMYIPGGTAPLLSTVLMLGIPAKLAGCKDIILCSPPNKEGKIHYSILYTAKYIGIHRIYKLGGAQAIAAMTYGTESIPSVYKIFGPGNFYVNKAKQILSSKKSISIDLPAGPSEIVIIADHNANPYYVATDLLSQLEHDPESYAIIITTNYNNSWIRKIKNKLKKQIQFFLERKKIIENSIKNSKIIVLSSLEECMILANKIAPEHLIINCKKSFYWSNKVSNAGSVFLGNYTPVSAGDYASGTNHVLPTNGNAKSYSGITIDSFLKKIMFQKISKRGLKDLSKCIKTLSNEEGLIAHKESINVRLN